MKRDPLHVHRALAELRDGRPAPDPRDSLRSFVCWLVGCDYSRGGQFCSRCGRFLP